MSAYTTELRYICEMKSGFSVKQLEEKTVNEIITASRPKIFDFSYPLFNENYKETLEFKILKHYYTREICCETYGLWKHFLDMTMNEIMPKYNKLYELESMMAGKYLNNIDVYHKNIRTNDLVTLTNAIQTNNLSRIVTDVNDTNENINKNDLLKDLFSDTPQGTLSGVDSETYLTDYRKNINKRDENRKAHYTNNSNTKDTGNVKNDTNQKNTGTVDDNGHEYGYRGSKQLYEILYDYTEKVINIDNRVIADLSDLFFKLW